jgi:hypothetical protein
MRGQSGTNWNMWGVSRVNRKAQSSMMEYLLMSLFVLMVIIVLILFLSWWQLSQINMEERNIKNHEIISLMDQIGNSPVLAMSSMDFDDSRLTAVASLGNEACTDLRSMLGGDWYIEVDVLDPEPGCERPCDASSYPCCSSWSLCGRDAANVSMVMPANVYRKATGMTDLALLRVGVYS